MNPRSKLLAAYLGIFLAAGQFSRADVPNGVVSFSFDSSSAPVYDVTGSFGFEQTMIGVGDTEIPLSFGVDLAQDVRGGIRGSGETLVNVGNDFIAAAYTVRGRISGGGGNTLLTLTVRLHGEDVVAGVDTKFSITLVYTLTPNPDSGAFEGTVRGTARFSGLGHGRIDSDVSVGLPAGVGGWTLQMNIVPLDHLVGSAQIILANGRTLQAHLIGSFSTDTQEATVKISGFGDSRGNSATVIFNPDLIFLHGRILGQLVDQ